MVSAGQLSSSIKQNLTFMVDNPPRQDARSNEYELDSPVYQQTTNSSYKDQLACSIKPKRGPNQTPYASASGYSDMALRKERKA